jgi:hypothetical protein
MQRQAQSRLASTIIGSNIPVSSFCGSVLVERAEAHPIGLQPVSAAQCTQ